MISKPGLLVFHENSEMRDSIGMRFPFSKKLFIEATGQGYQSVKK